MATTLGQPEEEPVGQVANLSWQVGRRTPSRQGPGGTGENEEEKQGQTEEGRPDVTM